MLQKTLFNRVIYKGILGSIMGIISGFILGLFIFVLQQIAAMTYYRIIPSADSYNAVALPFEVIITLSMCFGAIIGSVFGSISALKEDKKK